MTDRDLAELLIAVLNESTASMANDFIGEDTDLGLNHVWIDGRYDMIRAARLLKEKMGNE